MLFRAQLLSPRIVIPLIICCFASTLAFGSVVSTLPPDLIGSLDAYCSPGRGPFGCGITAPFPLTQAPPIYVGGGSDWGGSPHLPDVLAVIPISFTFSGPVTGFSSQVTCEDSNCTTDWSGLLPSGVISANATFYFDDGKSLRLTFRGTYTGGRFDGRYTVGSSCYFISPCYLIEQSVGFSGTWSNGWTSTGRLSEQKSNIPALEDDGNVSMLVSSPSIPEPTSIALLGSGVLSLIGYGRKRLRM